MANVAAPKHAKTPKHARVDASGANATGFKPQNPTAPFSLRQRIGFGVACIAIACCVCVALFPLEMDAYGSTADGAEPEDTLVAQTKDIGSSLSDEELAQLSQVVADGTPLPFQTVYALADSPQDYTANVGEMLQAGILRGGCEIVSLDIALHSMGFDISATDIADNYLETNGNFATGYAGSPYESGGGFPPAIVAAANAYLQAQASDMRAHNLTGSSFEALKGIVATGRPVLVWTTMYAQDPMHSGIFQDGAEWYSNEHCVVLCGAGAAGVQDAADTDAARVAVSDPMEGIIVRDEAEFARIYEECGCMAVGIW